MTLAYVALVLLAGLAVLLPMAWRNDSMKPEPYIISPDVADRIECARRILEGPDQVDIVQVRWAARTLLNIVYDFRKECEKERFREGAREILDRMRRMEGSI